MARLLANSNVAAAICRRGYSSVASAVGSKSSSSSMKVVEEQKMMKGSKIESGVEAAWVPDPVTGYYRPANRLGEMDPADLRRILLSRKT